MAKQVINNGMSAKVVRGILNSNFDELYNEKAIKNHASSTTDFGVASTTNFGHIKVQSANGLTVTNGVLKMNLGTTSQAGAVQLVNNSQTNDATKAATAAALKSVSDAAIKTFSGTEVPSQSVGKDGDLYVMI